MVATLDLDAIAVAIAHRFDPGVTTPPAPVGLDDIRESTADLPNALGPLPAVLVFTERGTLKQGGQTRIGVSTYRIRFYLAEGIDLARDEVQLRKWATVLIRRFLVATTLAGAVDRIGVTSWTIGAMHYADTEYSGIELIADAVTSEAWAAS